MKKPSKRTSLAKRWSPGAIVGDRIFRNVPFMLFLGGLALAMVYNVHRAQATLRSIERERAALQDLRWEASAVQAQIMYDNKQSEVLRRVKPKKLGLAGTNPRRLVAAR